MTFPAGSRLLAEDMSPVARLLAPPRARLRQTSGQSISNATFTALQWQAEDVDTVGGHDNVTNNSRYTAQVAGLYHLTGKHAWPANATGQRASQWFVNGSALVGSQSAWPAVAAVERQYVAVPMDIVLAVGDYVELHAYQDSGGSLSTSVASTIVASIMTIRWVGVS